MHLYVSPEIADRIPVIDLSDIGSTAGLRFAADRVNEACLGGKWAEHGSAFIGPKKPPEKRAIGMSLLRPAARQ